MSFQGKAVLVTGASSGIGAAIAKQFATEGAKVAIVGRNEKKLKNVEAAISKIGIKPKVIVADLTNDKDVKRIVDETIADLGALDVLVNNAGMSRVTNISADNVMELYDLVLSTNLRAVVNLTHHALPHLISTKGNIVNISSPYSKLPSNVVFSYCIAKEGVNLFTKCMAIEMAPQEIRVNTVLPGLVKTDMIINSGYSSEEADRQWENAKKNNLLHRISEPEEIADVVLFLASAKAKGITGSLHASDNGALLCGGRWNI